MYPALSFTMELKDKGKLPFLGMVIIINGPQLDNQQQQEQQQQQHFITRLEVLYN